MAAARRRVASIANDQSYVDFGYDDVSNICNRVWWANLQPVPVLVFVNHPDGSELLRATIPSNTAEQTQALNGQRRFNIETESPSVNLAS